MSKIVEKFDDVCLKNKDRCAFYYREKNKIISKTFLNVYNDTNNMVCYLLENGVKKGDKILAFASSNYKLCIFIMAAFKIGAVVMYVDVLAKQDRLKSLFEKYEPKYLLVSNKTKYIRFTFKEINKIKNIINVDKVENYKITDIHLNTLENQIALLTTTTGTTDIPKIVIRTHENLNEQLNLIIKNINKCSKDVIVLTTSYIYVFANILQGFTTVLPNINLRLSENYLNKKLSLFKDIDINMIITSPDFCIKTNNIYPKLEYLYFGGAILNYKEAITIKNKFNNNHNIYMYGCTECNLISKIDLDKFVYDLKKEGINNLGEIVKGVEVEIGSNNEIYVNSKALINNYIGKEFDKNEKHDTQDRGYLRKGEIVYLGKSNAILNINNQIIYSNQIEQDLILEFDLNKCAILEYNNKFYLFIEDISNYMKIKQYLKEKYKIDINIKSIKKIPCDIKHHTKINYNKLKELIK